MGVDKTKEMCVVVMKLAEKIAEVSKDGMQAKDAIEVLQKIQDDAEFKAMLLDVYNNIDQVKVEVKDIGTFQFIGLAMSLLPSIKSLIAAVSK